MNGASVLQPVVDVAVQEQPRLGRDVVGEQELLASEGEREDGAPDQVDSAIPPVPS